MKRRLGLTGLCLVGLSLLGGCRAAPLREPEPVLLAAAEPEMRAVILEAMKRRSPGWRMVEEDTAQKRIRARIHNRAHVATVDIFYTSTEVRIRHVDSQGLKESTASSGVKKIHRAYNTWVVNLRNDIEDELRIASMNRAASTGG